MKRDGLFLFVQITVMKSGIRSIQKTGLHPSNQILSYQVTSQAVRQIKLNNGKGKRAGLQRHVNDRVRIVFAGYVASIVYG